MSLQDEAWRLVRRHWRSAQELARELYRMFTNEKAVQDFSGPGNNIAAIRHGLTGNVTVASAASRDLTANITLVTNSLVVVSWNYAFSSTAGTNVTMGLFVDGDEVDDWGLVAGAGNDVGGSRVFAFQHDAGTVAIKGTYTNAGANTLTLHNNLRYPNNIVAVAFPGVTLTQSRET